MLWSHSPFGLLSSSSPPPQFHLILTVPLHCQGVCCCLGMRETMKPLSFVVWFILLTHCLQDTSIFLHVACFHPPGTVIPPCMPLLTCSSLGSLWLALVGSAAVNMAEQLALNIDLTFQRRIHWSGTARCNPYYFLKYLNLFSVPLELLSLYSLQNSKELGLFFLAVYSFHSFRRCITKNRNILRFYMVIKSR